jgi:GNAT superfamily N-acetyltransferase
MNERLIEILADLKKVETEDTLYERPGQATEQVVLTGTRFSIRGATPTDGEALCEMLSRSSSETIYLRFHIPYPAVPGWMVALMLDADHHDKESLVAVAEEEIVGHVMYVRLGDGHEAEMAIIVEDGWQSKGVGKSLLLELARRARLRGIETFTAEVLGQNRRMLGLAAAMFAGTDYTIEDGVYHVRMPLRTLEPETYTARTLPRAA